MGKFTDRTGEKRMMNCGMEAEIITYHGRQDLDIRFSDGVERCNMRYDKFLLGNIQHPNQCVDRQSLLLNRLHKKRILNNGLEAEIIAYHNEHNIDVRFKDGSFCYNKHYKHFVSGDIGHPTLRLRYDRVTSGSTLANFSIRKLAYRLKEVRDTFYLCDCIICGVSDILTPMEMLEHECEVVNNEQ